MTGADIRNRSDVVSYLKKIIQIVIIRVIMRIYFVTNNAQLHGFVNIYVLRLYSHLS